MRKQKDIGSFLSDEEKEAIAILVGKYGFSAFTEAKLEDVRELDTGRRRRTFRNQGRYDLVLAAKRIDERKPAQPEDKPKEPQVLKPVEEMTVKELRAEARRYPRIIGEYQMAKADLAAAVKAERDRRKILFRRF